MAHIQFSKDFSYDIPDTASTIVYRAGDRYTVTRDCAEKAKAAGVAVDVPPKGKLSDGEDEARRG